MYGKEDLAESLYGIRFSPNLKSYVGTLRFRQNLIWPCKLWVKAYSKVAVHILRQVLP